MFTKEKNAFKVIRNCPNWFIPTRIFLSLSSHILTIFLCSSDYQTSLITVSKLHLKRNACLMLSSQNIQSTNWQTMRFKPPPPNSSIGWRVEFRPTEVRWLFLPPPPLPRVTTSWDTDVVWLRLNRFLFNLSVFIFKGATDRLWKCCVCNVCRASYKSHFVIWPQSPHSLV